MLKLHNMISFSTEVERLVREDDLSYLEATIQHLEKCGIDIDHCKFKNFLTPTIIQKIEDEAVDLRMIGRGQKKQTKLPL